MPSSYAPLRAIRCATSGLARIASLRDVRSFHITNLPKENWPTMQSSETASPGRSRTAARKMPNTFSTSTPESSVGSGSSPGTESRYSARSISRSVVLTIVSSSIRRMR